MEQASVSEIQRNLHKLNDFDIIEVVDKKRGKLKGYFVDSKYALLIKEMSEKFVKDSKKNRRSLRGVFSEYSDSSKIKEEEGIWQRHVVDKFSKNG